MTAITYGTPEPLGVTLQPGGINVAVYSAMAEAIELCLFDEAGRETRLQLPSRTGSVHHGFVAGITEGQRYGLRAHGPWRPQEGLRFNPAKLLVDPYATRLVRPDGLTSGLPSLNASGLDDLVADTQDTAPTSFRCVVEAPPVPTHRPPRPRPAHRIVYELHVKGFTRLHPDVPPELRGTFAGLAHPAAIDHLVQLGVTTVELMPVAAWLDERHLPALGLRDYWGYNPVAFLAPDPRLAPGGMAEVAATVDALHAAGLEVILDVVFNHTAESDEHGQTLSLRGLDNTTYYRLAGDRRFYTNESGCGNTLALERPAPLRLAMDALRHWAEVGGVDGYRFDLAPVLGRREGGFDPDAPLLTAIDQDPILRDRLMVAEPWDIGRDGYHLGGFPSRWGEWNDKYRDDVRRFWRGDGNVAALATRLAGSSDVFGGRRRHPSASVNFVAAHDGFTLRDVVTYSYKRNSANGENNRDGNGSEAAWNNGFEGPTEDAAILAARDRAVRAMLATLFFSRGLPMLQAGDEFGRSQLGNNNAYAQDNETTWIDWSKADHALSAFVARLVDERSRWRSVLDDTFLTGQPMQGGVRDVEWLDGTGRAMEDRTWFSPYQRTLGMELAGVAGAGRALLWLHSGLEPARVVMPAATEGQVWRPRLDSANPDGAPDSDHPVAPGESFELSPGSVTLFVEVAGQRQARRRTGVDDAELAHLAEAAGIAPDWYDLTGQRTEVPLATKQTLLTAMGLPTGSSAQVKESLDRIEAARPKTPFEAPHCYTPEGLQGQGRRFGVAAQLYTLRRKGDGGIGDFTTLGRFAKAAAAKGAATLALNPFHMMFPSDRGRVSPYQPSDRRYLDPLYIDLHAVPEADERAARRMLQAQGAELAGLEALRFVDYAAVWRLKLDVLRACFAALPAEGPRRDALEAFRGEGGPALERFALYQALEAEAGGGPHRFPGDTEARPPERVRAMDFAVYLQFLADEQLAAAADSGLSIGLYRDLAVGAAPDGAETWTGGDAFMHGVSVGSPPDPFSQDGQLWGLPPLSPLVLAETGFEHYRGLLAANMRHAGALRIDHAMALSRLFIVPDGAPALQGAYVRYPMDGMLAVLAEESVKAKCLVVGEDLGTVQEGFREKINPAGILSYRVLFFEREGIGGGAGFLPAERYPATAVACVATHDLATLKGWWGGADIALNRALGRPVSPNADTEREAGRAALARTAGDPGLADGPMTPGLVADVHRFLARTPSKVALVQVEDVAGEADPVNLPGTSDEYPNWRRRIPGEADTLLDSEVARETWAAMEQEGRSDVGST